MSSERSATTQTAPPTVPVAAGTTLRKGASTQGPNNIIGQPLAKGSYPALAQCAGGAVTEGGAVNFWWVKIDTPQGTGWVSAVRVLVGGNNEPIPGVPQVPTVQGN